VGDWVTVLISASPIRKYLGHCEVPVVFYFVGNGDNCNGYCPVFHFGGIWIEREYLQVDGIEIIDGDGSLRVRIEILVHLLQYSVDIRGALWRRKKS
jgi:hypothetical protein